MTQKPLSLLFWLMAALSGAALGQPVEWVKAYEPTPVNLVSYGFGGLSGGIVHPNGGLLAIGYGGANYQRIDGVFYTKPCIIRLNADGDYLDYHVLPGTNDGSALQKPFLLGRDPYSDGFIALCSKDSTDWSSPGELHYGFYLTWLDSAGATVDSLLFSEPHGLPVMVDARFITKNRFVWTGTSYHYDPRGFSYGTMDVHCVQLPLGIEVWKRSFRFHDVYNTAKSIIPQPGGKFWLGGVAGSHVILAKIDSNGTHYGAADLWQTPDSVVPFLEQIMPLPQGRLAVNLTYDIAPGNGLNDNLDLLLKMDTLGHTDWQCRRYSDLTYFYPTWVYMLTPNDDGGFTHVYRNKSQRDHAGYPHDIYSLWRRNGADSTILENWALSDTSFNMKFDNTTGVAYAGDGSAYFFLSGGPAPHTNAHSFNGYCVMKLRNYGFPYSPTATAGPRARPLPLTAALFPNPARDFFYIDSDKPLQYRIYTATGATVQQGTLSRSEPAHVAALATGLYQIVLTDGHQSVVKRLVKE